MQIQYLLLTLLRRMVYNKDPHWVMLLLLNQRTLHPAAICWHFSYKFTNTAFNNFMQHINIAAFQSDVTTFIRRMCVYEKAVCGIKDRSTEEPQRGGIYRNLIINSKHIQVEFSVHCCSKYSLSDPCVGHVIGKVPTLTQQIKAQIQVNQRY